MIFAVQAFYVHAKFNHTPPNYMKYAHGFVVFYLARIVWLILEWFVCGYSMMFFGVASLALGLSYDSEITLKDMCLIDWSH